MDLLRILAVHHNEWHGVSGTGQECVGMRATDGVEYDAA